MDILEKLVRKCKEEFFEGDEPGAGLPKPKKQFLVVYGRDVCEMQELCERFSHDTGYFAFPLFEAVEDERALVVNYDLLLASIPKG